MALSERPRCGRSLTVDGRVVKDAVLVKGRVVVVAREPVPLDRDTLQGWDRACLNAETARVNDDLREAARAAREAVVAEAEALVAEDKDSQEP
ncbi:hypothetical protein M8C11_18800 [Micromonospora sp. CPM1]|uniref:hypothetical protein n=1 Tax=Micromonospora sp. CPM1 TaxID=2944809 RepID=UPI00207D13C7|nr:hypothetical protein [Micromonospora sp. CPM1]MCO1616766.1 hypothetical protein [Micromonospora sp. CPM1]